MCAARWGTRRCPLPCPWGQVCSIPLTRRRAANRRACLRSFSHHGGSARDRPTTPASLSRSPIASAAPRLRNARTGTGDGEVRDLRVRPRGDVPGLPHVPGGRRGGGEPKAPPRSRRRGARAAWQCPPLRRGRLSWAPGYAARWSCTLHARVRLLPTPRVLCARSWRACGWCAPHLRT